MADLVRRLAGVVVDVELIAKRLLVEDRVCLSLPRPGETREEHRARVLREIEELEKEGEG